MVVVVGTWFAFARTAVDRAPSNLRHRPDIATSLRRATMALAALCALGIGACTDEDPGPCTMFRGRCIGVPPGALCDDDHCTDDVSCARIIELEDGDDLAAHAAGATAGTCIALAEGRYSGATLPSGVSLLGRSAHHVTVGALTVKAGSGAVLRGLRVEGGLSIGSAAVRVQAMHIAGASGDGIRIEGSGDVTVADCQIDRSGLHGVLALDAERLRLERTIVRGSKGPGLWVQCASGCDCPAPPVVSLSHVLVEQNRHVGLGLRGAHAELSSVTIHDTQQLTEPVQLPGGGGLFASECSDLEANQLTVDGAVDFGILLDGSTASLGSDAESKGIIIVGTKVGIWLSNIEQGATIRGAEVADVRGVGIGIGGDLGSKGIIIVGTKVFRTQTAELLVEPAIEGRSQTVGHGFVWGGGAEVRIDGLTLAGNAIQSMLIDGPVAPGSMLKDVVLTDGDDDKGIVQQAVMAADPAPDTEGSTPAIAREPMAVAEVPVPPQLPLAVE